MEMKVISAKYYAVLVGRKTGIFYTWSECQQQVKGYPGAKFKSFSNRAEANDWLHGFSKTRIRKGTLKSETHVSSASIHFWTDGGSRNHGNKKGEHVKPTDPAAWAFCVIKDGKKYTASGGEYGSTNNRMEVMGLVKTLKFLGRQGWQKQQILGTLDSRYVLDAINKNWVKSWQKRNWKTVNGHDVANQELWREMAKLLPYFNHLKFEWTKGHAENEGNILVDKLLNETMNKM